ncbi:MAG: TIGR04086 family membrane protein [Oscillospiraceae bacterium]|nr:TIGR04086 family membrane protein [Oscillospiraceae bacterium]
MKKRQKKSPPEDSRYFMVNSILKSQAAGLIVFISVVSALSFLMIRRDFPDKFMFLFLFSAAAFSAFAASFYLTRKVRMKGLLSGFISSSILCVIEIIGIAAFNYGKTNNLIYGYLLFMPLTGMVTGIFAANFKRRIKSKM